MEKVKLTKEQAEEIENTIKEFSTQSIIENHVNSAWSEGDPLYELSLDTLIRALYIGYEVEQTVEERLLIEYTSGNDRDYNQVRDAYRKGILVAIDIIGMKVKGIND